jgi:exosortase/archaeosortase family protein
MAKQNNLKGIAIYVSLAVAITLVVYYVPSYYILKSSIATFSTSILKFLDLSAQIHLVEGHVILGTYEIVRDCTGVQVFAVFLGLILPLPKVPWRKKACSLIVLAFLLYVSNLFRVVLEYWLVENQILPWSIAHYPLSLIMGIIGVFFLVLINNLIIPEFGDYVFALAKRVKGFFSGCRD